MKIIVGIILVVIVFSCFKSKFIVGQGLTVYDIQCIDVSIFDNRKGYFSMEDCEKSELFSLKQKAASKQYLIDKDSLLMESKNYRIILDEKGHLLCRLASDVTYSDVIKTVPKFSNKNKCEQSDDFKLLMVDQKNKINKSIEDYNRRLKMTRIDKINAFVDENPEYEEYTSVAKDRKISIGMPEMLVVLSWGSPRNINETINGSGIHKQLVYNAGYIYIDNGIVTSIQNN